MVIMWSYILFLIYISLNLGITSNNISCYECEIVDRERQMSLWPCDQSSGPWQKAHNCKVCMWIQETQRMEFRKPRWGQQYNEINTMSKLCLRNFEPPFSDGCTQLYGSSSTQKLCYCSQNYCNDTKILSTIKFLLWSAVTIVCIILNI